jgi:Flp pilus assembly pilin Flp
MRKPSSDLLSDSSASTTIEYGLVAALVAAVALIGLGAVAEQTNGMWNAIESQTSEALAAVER